MAQFPTEFRSRALQVASAVYVLAFIVSSATAASNCATSTSIERCNALPDCFAVVDLANTFQMCAPFTTCKALLDIASCVSAGLGGKNCTWNGQSCVNGTLPPLTNSPSTTCTSFTTNATCAASGSCSWTATGCVTINVDPCRQLDTQQLCASVAACAWSGTTCNVLPLNPPNSTNCTSFSNSTLCNKNPYCWWVPAKANSGTSPTVNETASCYPYGGNCSMLTDGALCTARNCTWNADTKTCWMWRPESGCTAITNGTQCNMNASCWWAPAHDGAGGMIPASCYPYGGNCSMLTDGALCTARNCTWDLGVQVCVPLGSSTSYACSLLSPSPLQCTLRSPCIYNQTTARCVRFARCSQANSQDLCQQRKWQHCAWDSATNGCINTTLPVPCEYRSMSSCTTNVSCTIVNEQCVPRCPGAYIQCPGSGTCAKSVTECTAGCASTQVQCWDTTCVSSPDKCSCPPQLPVRCNNTGACVANASSCKVECALVTCWDGSCAGTPSRCPCPMTQPFRCNTSERCVSDPSQCNTSCPRLTPVLCWNGGCAISDLACPCNSSAPARCSTDSQCYASHLQCPCDDASMSRCPNRPEICSKNCSATCLTGVQCPDGTCAASRYLCPCVSTASRELPVVTVNVVSTTFDVGRYLRLPSVVQYSVCGVDRSDSVAVSWTFVYSATNSPVALPNTAIVRGATAAVPPNVFPVNVPITATVVANTTNGLASSTSIALLFTAAPPIVVFVGGTRATVMAGSPLSAQIQVTDTYAGRDTRVWWRCCVVVTASPPTNVTNVTAVNNNSDADHGCMAPCKFFDAPLPSTGARVVKIDTTNTVASNASRFVLYATYANVTVWQRIEVLALPTAGGENNNETVVFRALPSVSIQPLADIPFAGRGVFLYAEYSMAVSALDGATVAWLLNGTTITEAVGKASRTTLQLLGSALAATQTYNVTIVVSKVFNGVTYAVTSSSVFTVLPLPAITCSVSSSDANVTALSSTISIVATMVDGQGNALPDFSTVAQYGPEFRFGLLDLQNNMSLSQAYQGSATLRRIAPVVAAFKKADADGGVNIRFFVVMRLNSAMDVAFGWCTRRLFRYIQNSSTVVGNAQESLSTATLNGDVATVISAAQLLSNAAASASGDNASALARSALSDVTNALQSTVGDSTKQLSSEQRSAVVSTVRSIVAAVNGSVPSSTRSDLLKVLRQTITITNGSSGATSDSDFLPLRDGAAVLQAVSDLSEGSNNNTGNDGGQNSGSSKNKLDGNATLVAERLAAALALASSPGQTNTLVSGSIALLGVTRAASDMDNRVISTDDGTAIALPPTFSSTQAGSSSTVSMAVASYATNPYDANGVDSNATLKSSVVDFTTLAGSQTLIVRNCSPPIQFSVTLDVDATFNASENNVTCHYRNTVTNEWSTDGVTTVAYNDETRVLTCNTTHLSTFAVFTILASPKTSSTTPSPGGGANPDASPAKLSSGVTAAIAVSAVVVVAAVVAVVIVKQRNSSSAHRDSSTKEARVTLDRQEMVDLYAMNPNPGFTSVPTAQPMQPHVAHTTAYTTPQQVMHDRVTIEVDL